MLFPRIDVRRSLLTGTDKRCGRQVGEVEIALDTATCKAAVELLERGHSAVRRYDVQQARVNLCSASELARNENDGFVEAAATMLQTIQMDGISPAASQPHFLGLARTALGSEILLQEERFFELRAKPDVAQPIMLPRLALAELVESNLAQYQMRDRSKGLADTRVDIDRHINQRNWFAAENRARSGMESAGKLFGVDHWWYAVMSARLVEALAGQRKTAGVARLASIALVVLDEWAVDDVFDSELAFLRSAVSG